MKPNEQLQLAISALEKIHNLRNATQVKGDIYSMGTEPEDADGFVPMPPVFRDGIKHAADIAFDVLEKIRES